MIPINCKSNGYIRISKAKARKIYNNGGYIFMLPCKVSPAFNPWIIPARFNKSEFCTAANVGIDTVVPRNREFETVVNCYSYYNCNNELGKYPAFYVMEG